MDIVGEKMPLDFVLLAILGIGAGIFGHVFFMLGASFAKQMRRQRRRHRSQIEAEIIAALAAGIDLPEVQSLQPSPELRDTIAACAVHLAGEDRRRLLLLYAKFGFARQDLKELFSIRNWRCAQALRRSRDLLSPLPDFAWRHLLGKRSFAIRWAAAEYLVTLKGRASLPWILPFLNLQQIRAQGAALHILSSLAATSPETLTMIAEHTDNQFIIELCLRCMANYPSSSAESCTLRLLKVHASEETFIAAMKVLKRYPTSDVLTVYKLCVKHPHWVVRLEIAKGLAQFMSTEAVELLEDLTIDTQYYVRVQSLSSLIAMGHPGASVLAAIENDPDHPSHQILKGMLDDLCVAA